MKPKNLFFLFFLLVSIFAIGFILGKQTNENTWLERATIYELAHMEYVFYYAEGWTNKTFVEWYKTAMGRDRNFTQEVNDFFEEVG